MGFGEVVWDGWMEESYPLDCNNYKSTLGANKDTLYEYHQYWF